MSTSTKILVFNEQLYPLACSTETISKLLPTAYDLAEASNLAHKLADGYSTLVSFQGPYFPKQAWPAILRFLERGGNLAIFGGVPFSRPVAENGLVEPEQQAYTRKLYLGPFFSVDLAETAEVKLVGADAAVAFDNWSLALVAQKQGYFWSFDPKLTQISDHPAELGSAGSLDTALIPLIFATTSDGAGNLTKIATPAFLLDQREGSFRGGRWLISAWQPTNPAQTWLENSFMVQTLLRLTFEGCNSLEVQPLLASLQAEANEATSLVIKANTRLNLMARLTLFSPQQARQTFEVEFAPSNFPQEKRLPLPAQTEPGLYRVETIYQASEGSALRQTTGFWVWDAQLVAQTAGKRLTAGRDYFYQAGQPFLVYGTTYMDSVVQRRFLQLPNPARWDTDFAEMKAAGVNLIRTGIWTAWRQFVPLPGEFNETALRALDAFVMTACKHNIQLIFTFFSFSPPLFEGTNPWLDPRSLRGQQEFVSAIVRRYAGIELVFWDLINEPSFGDPARIFAQRPIPNYDHFELDAFREWLQARYSLAELQQRWQLTPAEFADWTQLSLPEANDYVTDVRNNNPRKLPKAADYTLFSQEKFNQWAALMAHTIEAAGSQTLVGVGQDEAGVRIAPQFYAESMAYTTTHPWWNTDMLLWDMLSDKTPFKPNLLQETGVMLVTDDLTGSPWRTPQENANLLERKLLTGLAARGAGLVQWLWHTNPYMTSDNENSIGLVRADGSAKPELAAFKEFGRLVENIARQIKETAKLPEVWLITPYSQYALRPELGSEATQRAVRTLGYDLGIIPQVVGEFQLAQTVQAGQIPTLVIVPGLQFLSREAWEALQSLARQGATVVINGVIRPEVLYQFPGFEPAQADFTLRPVSRYEQLTDLNGQTHQLVFDGEKMGYLKKAHNQCRIYPLGQGRLIWCGLPLELAASSAAVRSLYRQFLGQPSQAQSEDNPFFVSRHALKAGELVIIVSESASSQKVNLSDDLALEVAPNRAGAVVLLTGQPAKLFGGVELVYAGSLVQK